MPFHILHTQTPRPERMNNPFCYEPHPLCEEAAGEVRAYLSQHLEWAKEIGEGKMFGVLVCEDEAGQLGFLAAYSGQIGGREDWPWFVPAVFDYLQPDGYFKQEEARISQMNGQVKALEAASLRQQLLADLHQQTAQAQSETAAYKALMQTAKDRREQQRKEGTADDEALIRESQFQKAELRRLKKRWNEKIAATEAQLQPLNDEIAALKQERHRRSDALQHWLFDHFVMLNAQGEQRSLTDIFAETPQGVPPSGSGECCAPKLLQYAYAHRLRPLSMAEFWQGRSPRMEVRHHNCYYPACRGKCRPILEWMLPICSIDSISPIAPMESMSPISPMPIILHATSTFLVISKPAGLLSVPGLKGEPSVEDLLKAQYPEVYMVHRLDMDTSGLMVVALQKEAYHHLQRQFLEHTVHKEYVALLEQDIDSQKPAADSQLPTISLPLRPDLDDRPRQVVDMTYGKPALTTYEALGGNRVRLTPHTGRTHQLRVHCAHRQGLDNPILGDPLYGRVKAERLYLHAEVLEFDDPVSGQRLTFQALAPF